MASAPVLKDIEGCTWSVGPDTNITVLRINDVSRLPDDIVRRVVRGEAHVSGAKAGAFGQVGFLNVGGQVMAVKRISVKLRNLALREFVMLRKLRDHGLTPRPSVFILTPDACYVCMGALQDTGRDPPPDRLAKAIRALHKAGFAHTDIKRDNLVVTRDNEVYLLDVGLVMERGPDRAEPDEQCRKKDELMEWARAFDWLRYYHVTQTEPALDPGATVHVDITKLATLRHRFGVFHREFDRIHLFALCPEKFSEFNAMLNAGEQFDHTLTPLVSKRLVRIRAHLPGKEPELGEVATMAVGRPGPVRRALTFTEEDMVTYCSVSAGEYVEWGLRQPAKESTPGGKEDE